MQAVWTPERGWHDATDDDAAELRRSVVATIVDCARHPRSATATARTYSAPDGRVRHVDNSVTWCSSPHAIGATDSYPLAPVPAYAFRVPGDAGYCTACGIGRGHNRAV